MLYYGDTVRFEEPSSVRRSIAEKLGWASEAPPGRERHEILVRAFIETGELVQSLVDQEFDETGMDDISDLQTDGAALLLSLALAVKASWAAGFLDDLCLRDDWKTILGRLDGPAPLRIKRGEGYAFYCLYPENYIEAAATSGLSERTVVIGLRSIGTSLAALVAAALDARAAFTLRPAGHPFERRVTLTPALAQAILRDPISDFAIVDEGPGLSGSSFGCVADWLVARGVPRRRIHFFPSHAGPMGPNASPAHRVLWEEQPRHVLAFDDDAIRIDRQVRDWAAELAGEQPRRWQDISGGAWRERHYSSHEAWPAVHASMERRKFLLHGEERSWVVKFAGIDEMACQRLKVGAALSEAGFTPRQAGAVYGFRVQEWLSAKPLTAADSNDDVIDAVGRYLGFRARHLIPPHGGASLSELCDMAVFNTESALGGDLARILRKKLDHAGPIARHLRRVDTDNRLHSWEWLLTDSGRIFKTDATDHCAAHDLVGCQDIAWDIAGAAVEFGLTGATRARLAEAVAAEADCEPADTTLDVFELCYLAFQIGSWTYARMAAAGEEIPRIDGRLKHYSDRLALLLRG